MASTLLGPSAEAAASLFDLGFSAPRRRASGRRSPRPASPQAKAPVADLPVPIPRPRAAPEPAPAPPPVSAAPPAKGPVAPTLPAPPPGAPIPGVAAPGPARQPNADADCLARLKATEVATEPASLGTQPDARCTVVDAVKLTGLTLADGASVAFPDAPTLACVTVDRFAAYVRELLVPLAKGSYGAPVAKVWTGPGLECRSRDHIAGAKLSAHGQGLAVDIAQIGLADGRRIAVGQPAAEADRAFEAAARAAGCGYFNTALGPGADPYHKTHWHFDLEPRGAKGAGKFCQ